MTFFWRLPFLYFVFAFGVLSSGASDRTGKGRGYNIFPILIGIGGIINEIELQIANI
jgi:hypothetical protein